MIAVILIGIGCAYLGNELCDFSPWCARKLVRWSAFRRYADPGRAEMRAEELAAVINARPGNLLKLITAAGFAAAAVVLSARRAVARESEAVDVRRRPEAMGSWGELQLRRLAELAGMSARCDFEEQAAVNSADDTQRPDMVMRLAGGKNIVVDSKVPLAAYLEAAESDDDAVRADRLVAHARHLREHVDRLAGKAYWAALSPSPEFVILFIPDEAFLAPALEHDPVLLEYALARRVHVATPRTLVSMLRTAEYAWHFHLREGRIREETVRELALMQPDELARVLSLTRHPSTRKAE